MAMNNPDWREQPLFPQDFFKNEDVRDTLKGLRLVLLGMVLGGLLFGWADILGYLTNVWTEGLSIAVTVVILDRLADRRTRRQREQDLKVRLVREARSNVNDVARQAINELWEHGWLSGHDGLLRGTDFYRANLQGAILGLANLQGTQLVEANLQGADLVYANLQGARLGEANLQGANLRGANLQGANLVYANLQGADLLRANLEHALILPPGSTDVLGNDYRTKFDENTILPDGTTWTPDTDWTRFSAFTDAYEWDTWYNSQQATDEGSE